MELTFKVTIPDKTSASKFFQGVNEYICENLTYELTEQNSKSYDFEIIENTYLPKTFASFHIKAKQL